MVYKVPWVCIIALLAARAASAEPLVQDTFDTGTDGWTISSEVGFNVGTVSRSNVDSAGLPTSGSLVLNATGPAGTYLAVQRCVSLSQPMQTFALSAKVMAPQVTTEGGCVGVWAFTFVTPDCSDPGGGAVEGFDLGSSLTPGSSNGVWTADIGLDANPYQAQTINSVETVVETCGAFSGTVYFDDVLFSTNVVAAAQGGRFGAAVAWKTTDGRIGLGTPAALSTDSSYFSFFDPSNVELILKILNGCGLNNNYWVFAAGMTNVATLMDVEDGKALLGIRVQTRQSAPYPTLADTSAFSTCP